MDGNDINNILDNICDKLGTTAKMLIPEMAGYMISKWAIFIVLGVIFMIVSCIFLWRIFKMRKENEKIVKLYVNKNGMVDSSERYVYYDDGDYFPPAFGLTLFFFIGAVLLCVGITKIIGWSLSPNAMTVMWIVDNLGKQ